jgi:F-type H+-transporting ATPase subunit delta
MMKETGMPLFESPPEAVDRVYAASLFELAEAEGGQPKLEEVAAELEEFVELTRQQPELSEFLSSRIVAVDKREASLNRMLGDGRVSDLILRFLLILNRKQRLMRFLTIVAAYQEMVQERFGRVEVDVYTRHGLNQEQIDDIRERLRSAIGREPVVYDYTDPNMLGGVKMQIGDRLFDDSIQTRLRNMTELLKKDGASLMRSNAQQAIDDAAPNP